MFPRTSAGLASAVSRSIIPFRHPRTTDIIPHIPFEPGLASGKLPASYGEMEIFDARLPASGYTDYTSENNYTTSDWTVFHIPQIGEAVSGADKALLLEKLMKILEEA